MFGDLLTIRVKSAEKALREGRWEEALRLAVAADLRTLPRGAAVLAAVAPRLLDRAREHFRAERIEEAQADLQRAEQACGGGSLAAEIAELRCNVQAVAGELARREHVRRQALDEARRRMEAGSLVGGERALVAAGSDAEAAHLREQMARRGADADRAAREARDMMSAGQWSLAAERVRRARMLDAHAAEVVRTESALCRAIVDRARAALHEGKWSRAKDELSCAAGVGDALPEKREMERLVSLAAEAAHCASRGDYAEARRFAALLAHEVGELPWLKTLQTQLASLEDLQHAVRTGPLGLAAEERPAAPRHKGRAIAVRAAEETIVAAPRSGAQGASERLMLIVDGGGSYLILRGGLAAIGRAASENPADIALLSDIGERHATVSRMEEDYFLLAARDVEVAGQVTRHRLLRDGDRLVLGRKAKMTFHLPSRCSATAVLALSDTTKMPQDVRRVVLLSGHATIGNGPTSHIQCRHASAQLVLFERDGQLHVRQRNDGHADTSAQALRLGESVEMAGVRLVLNAWEGVRRKA